MEQPLKSILKKTEEKGFGSDYEPINLKAKGAGLIPVTYIRTLAKNKEGKYVPIDVLHFLMFVTKGQTFYDNFGGKYERGDSSEYHTAVREFVEETDGVMMEGTKEEKIKKLFTIVLNKHKEGAIISAGDESYMSYVIRMKYFDPSIIPTKEDGRNQERVALWISFDDVYGIMQNKQLSKRLHMTGIMKSILKQIKDKGVHFKKL